MRHNIAHMYRWLAILLTLALPLVIGARHGGQATPVAPFVPDLPVSALPPPQVKLAYSVVIENKAGGVVRIVDPPAQFLLSRPGVDLGHVVRPATTVDTVGYHASSWGALQTVVASSVNALHLKVYDDTQTGRAGVITVLPGELLNHDLAGGNSRPEDDAIYTDIPGGHGIFGGSYPLIVGNPVSIYRDRQRIYFEPAKPDLKVGDVIIIEVRTPEQWPQGLIIDNSQGGAVTLVDAAGGKIGVATVDKPVSGSGRFAGGVFCESGGIRATHTAVLDLDFSPAKCTGGMQFIPKEHSKSTELTYSQSSPPYGILIGPNGSDMRDQAPVFNGYLYPNSQIEEPRVLPHLVVSVQLGNDTEWRTLPSLVGRTDLSDLSALRVDWTLATPAVPGGAPSAEVVSEPIDPVVAPALSESDVPTLRGQR